MTKNAEQLKTNLSFGNFEKMLTTSPEIYTIYSKTNEKRVTGCKGTINHYIIISINTVTKHVIVRRGKLFANIWKNFLFSCIARIRKG